MLPISAESPRAQVAICRYAATDGVAEPVELFGRIAAAGILLHRGEGELLAEVPQATVADRSWPTLDRRLARYAGSLAQTLSIARRFAAGRRPERVVAILAELRREVPEILLESVGGQESLTALIAREPRGPNFDLACVACCRGLAIRAIHRGQGLAGLLADGEHDDQERERGHQTAEARALNLAGRAATRRRGGWRP